jgi:hypothetical protein
MRYFRTVPHAVRVLVALFVVTQVSGAVSSPLAGTDIVAHEDPHTRVYAGWATEPLVFLGDKAPADPFTIGGSVGPSGAITVTVTNSSKSVIGSGRLLIPRALRVA